MTIGLTNPWINRPSNYQYITASLLWHWQLADKKGILLEWSLKGDLQVTRWWSWKLGQLNNTRKPSCHWQTRTTLAKSLHGLRNSSGVVSCIARLPIDSMPMLSYYVLYSICVCKMRRFRDTRLLKLPWPWNPGQGSLKVIESDIIR